MVQELVHITGPRLEIISGEEESRLSRDILMRAMGSVPLVASASPALSDATMSAIHKAFGRPLVSQAQSMPSRASITPKLLEELSREVHRDFLDDSTILSSKEYFDLVLEQPERHLHSSAQHPVDMLHYYGQEEMKLLYGRFNCFKLLGWSPERSSTRWTKTSSSCAKSASLTATAGTSRNFTGGSLAKD